MRRCLVKLNLNNPPTLPPHPPTRQHKGEVPYSLVPRLQPGSAYLEALPRCPRRGGSASRPAFPGRAWERGSLGSSVFNLARRPTPPSSPFGSIFFPRSEASAWECPSRGSASMSKGGGSASRPAFPGRAWERGRPYRRQDKKKSPPSLLYQRGARGDFSCIYNPFPPYPGAYAP